MIGLNYSLSKPKKPSLIRFKDHPIFFLLLSEIILFKSLDIYFEPILKFGQPIISIFLHLLSSFKLRLSRYYN